MGVGVVVCRFAGWGKMAHDRAPERAVLCHLVPAVEFEATLSCERHSHLRWGLGTYRAALRTHPGRYVHLPPLMRTSKSTLDLEVNHAVACVRIA